MGGILGRRAWERSSGGLWLPNVLWSPVQMGFCCCTEGEVWGSSCKVFSGTSWPSVVHVSIDVATDGACNCQGLVGDFEDIPLSTFGADTEFCYVIYSNGSSSGVLVSAAFYGSHTYETIALAVLAQDKSLPYPCNYPANEPGIKYGYGSPQSTPDLWMASSGPWPESGGPIDCDAYAEIHFGKCGVTGTATVTW